MIILIGYWWAIKIIWLSIIIALKRPKFWNFSNLEGIKNFIFCPILMGLFLWIYWALCLWICRQKFEKKRKKIRQYLPLNVSQEVKRCIYKNNIFEYLASYFFLLTGYLNLPVFLWNHLLIFCFALRLQQDSLYSYHLIL